MSRLLFVGLGPLGRLVLTDLFARGDNEVSAVIDVDPALHGRPVAELVPGAHADLRVLPSLDSITDWRGIDAALVTTSSELERCAPTFRALLGHGLAVVSSCEELAWPWLHHRALADDLDRAARDKGARLLGTGVNPGFVMDTLPLVASGACLVVRALQVERIQDAATRRIPFQKKIGAGLDLAAFEREVAAGRLRHVGLGESLHFLAHHLGFPLERWNETLEPVVASEALACALGPIPAGHASGVRQVAEGWVRGTAVLRLVFQAAIGQPEPHDRVQVDGDPPLDLVLRGGVHGDVATSALLLNALPALMEARPGLHTMASVRPARSVAAALGAQRS